MKLKTKSKIFRQFRHLFNVMMGIGYLAVAYIFLLYVTQAETISNTKLTLITIGLCGMAQISQYHDAYKEAEKDIFYYIGIIPPAIALLSITFAIIRAYLF